MLGSPDQQRRGGGHPDPRAQPEAAGEQEVERVGGGPGEAWVQGEHRHTARLSLELQTNNEPSRCLKLDSRHYANQPPVPYNLSVSQHSNFRSS